MSRSTVPEQTRNAFTTRPMLEADLEAAHGLTVALKWPHRLEDWQLMLRLGAGLVTLDGEGALVGSILWWPYGPDAATLGMVIVSDAHQGKGIGRRLMEAAMAQLDGRTILLNATVAGLPLYEKLGFAVTGAVEQRQGTVGPVPMVALEPDTRLRPFGRSDKMPMAACDTAATGMDRQALLAALSDEGETIVLDRDGSIAGYAICRRAGRGLVIGPVIADSNKAAKALIAHWLGAHSGQFTRLDIPVESGLSGWLDEMGLSLVDTVTCMSAGTRLPDPAPRAPRRFALGSQALG